ncbi:MAG TPA: hypothetical protein DCR55_09465 [Lentisphaeria bacterium]|jgi:Spy/CpxP family protein refolding chaperone|nr:hypothetical protein [Lentisphaeria bacterium]
MNDNYTKFTLPTVLVLALAAGMFLGVTGLAEDEPAVPAERTVEQLSADQLEITRQLRARADEIDKAKDAVVLRSKITELTQELRAARAALTQLVHDDKEYAKLLEKRDALRDEMRRVRTLRSRRTLTRTTPQPPADADTTQPDAATPTPAPQD